MASAAPASPEGQAPSPLPFSQVAPIFTLTFVDVLGLTVILPLLHLYAAAYGASPLEIGLVAAAFPLAQLVGVPIMGALSDRYGRKPLLLISQITTFISFIMLGLANSLWMVVLSRLFDGLFGANFSTAQAALSDITDESNRARGLGITGAAFGLGFVFGPFIALITLEMTDSLAIPALSAAGYSLMSILLTAFSFKETLPPEKRRQRSGVGAGIGPLVMWRVFRMPGMALLLLLIFAEQLVFYGFETLMGVFTLSRLGILGQGNALFFLLIGFVLVYTQVRLIGRWTARYGEARVVWMALLLLTFGLLLVALTPEIPQPFYVARNLAYDLRQQAPSSTESIIGAIGVSLPREGQNGLMGILWFVAALVPLSIGAGLIRPCLNSLMTRRATAQEYGVVLGVSASFVSAANACAPLLGGLLMQRYGVNLPFMMGAALLFLLALVAAWRVRPPHQAV